MKKIISLLFGILVVAVATAQTARTTTMKGTIVDAADNSPLIGALVVVDSTKHTTADVKGEFTIVLPVKESKVVITYLGYRTATQTVRVSGSVVNLGIIKMVSDDNYIEKVVVQGNAVISIQKGDTTQYSAAAYKTNPDAYAGDLLSKLPGMVVDDSGVKAQGQTVKRVYVDGKLMFGDEPLTAINNLPADAIESVQMFDELSDEAKFSGYGDGQLNRSINIITKYKIKTAATGRAEGGYGRDTEKDANGDYHNRYTFNTQANIFSAKRTVMLGATVNNTNSTTGRGGYGRGGGAGDGLNDVRNANFAYNQEWANLLKFNLRYMYNRVDSDVDKLTNQNYFPTSQFASRIYADTTQTYSLNNSHMGGMRIEYTPNRNNRIFFDPYFSYRESDSDSKKRQSNSTIYPNDPTNPFNTFTKTSNINNSKNINTGGNLNWMRNLGKAGRTISLSLNGGYSNSDGYITREDVSVTNPLNLETFSTGWSKNMRTRLTYNEPISLSSVISANYSIRYDNSSSKKLTYDINTNQLDEVLSNVFTRNYTTNSGGLAYSYTKGDTRLNFGTNYQSAQLNKNQELPVISTPENTFSFGNFLPYLSYRYNVDKTKNLQVNYNADVSLPAVEQLQNVINNSNPLQLSAGNRSLTESYTHSLFVKYNTSNLEKSTNTGIEFRASTTDNYVSYMTRYFSDNTILAEYNNFEAQKGSQLRTPVNLDGFYNFSTQINYAFPIKQIRSKMDLELEYAYEHLPTTYQVDKVDYTISHIPTARIQFESNISQNVDFSLSSRTRYTSATNSSAEVSDKGFFYQAFKGNLSLIFLKGFVLTSDITYTYNKDLSSNGFKQTFTVWNAGIGHKIFKKRQGEFKITMYDILQQNVGLRQSVNDQFISNTWTNVMGRYVMATFSYRFNSISNLQPNNGMRRGGDVPPGTEIRMPYGGGGMHGGGGPGGRF